MPYINTKQTHPLSIILDQKCLAVTVLHPQTLPFGVVLGTETRVPE
jgi:hypothetical protein